MFLQPLPQECPLISASFRLPEPPWQFVLEFYPAAHAHADNDLLRCCLQSQKEPFNQPPSERADQSGSVSIGRIQTRTPPPPPPLLSASGTEPRQTNKSESAGIPTTSIIVTVSTSWIRCWKMHRELKASVYSIVGSKITLQYWLSSSKLIKLYL